MLAKQKKQTSAQSERKGARTLPNGCVIGKAPTRAELQRDYSKLAARCADFEQIALDFTYNHISAYTAKDRFLDLL